MLKDATFPITAPPICQQVMEGWRAALPHLPDPVPLAPRSLLVMVQLPAPPASLRARLSPVNQARSRRAPPNCPCMAVRVFQAASIRRVLHPSHQQAMGAQAVPPSLEALPPSRWVMAQAPPRHTPLLSVL